MTICIITQSKSVISSGIHWNSKQNATNYETSHQYVQIFAVSEVSGGYNRNANSGTETDVAKLILYGNLWQLQTVNNSVPCLFAKKYN